MNEFLKKLMDGIAKFGIKLFVALLVFGLGFKIVDFIIDKLKRGKGFNKLEKSSQTFISSIINIVLKSLVTIMAIAELGISMTSIIAILGSAGLALGLALQGGLSNIAGGVMIMIFKPFKVGDYIVAGSDSGYVREINIFHTVLETLDGKTVVLPNGNLSNTIVVNYSTKKYIKVDLRFSVSYDSDIDKVKKVLNDVADKNEYVLQNKDRLIVLCEHADSALIFQFKVYVNSPDYWNAQYSLLEEVKKAFDKNKISIPYPQMDIHLDKK